MVFIRLLLIFSRSISAVVGMTLLSRTRFKNEEGSCGIFYVYF